MVLQLLHRKTQTDLEIKKGSRVPHILSHCDVFCSDICSIYKSQLPDSLALLKSVPWQPQAPYISYGHLHCTGIHGYQGMWSHRVIWGEITRRGNMQKLCHLVRVTGIPNEPWESQKNRQVTIPLKRITALPFNCKLAQFNTIKNKGW